MKGGAAIGALGPAALVIVAGLLSACATTGGAGGQ